MGSGAGFPGIALGALYPDVQLTMVESRQKRTTFLRQVVHQGKADNITVLCQRTEQLDGLFEWGNQPRLQTTIRSFGRCQKTHKGRGMAICMLGEQGSFTIPNEWMLVDEKVYLLDDVHGQRKRWLLKRIA